MTYDDLLDLFDGNAYHLCAILSLDIKAKRILGNHDSIDSIINKYTYDDVQNFKSNEYVKKIIKEAYPVRNPLA